MSLNELNAVAANEFDLMLYTRHDKERIFGKPEPTLEERTTLLYMWWDEWFENRYKIGLQKHIGPIHTLMASIGIEHFIHYQVRNGEIRFKEKTDLATAIMAGLGDIVNA